MRWLALMLTLLMAVPPQTYERTEAPKPTYEPAEQGAAAVVWAGEELWLLSADGVLLEKVPSPEAYPQVLGITPIDPAAGEPLEVSEEEREKLQAVRRLLVNLGFCGMLAEVTDFVAVDEEGTVCFGWGEELTVKVSPEGDMGWQIHAFQGVIRTFEEQGEALVGTLEMNYGDSQARLLPARWLPPAWAEREEK